MAKTKDSAIDLRIIEMRKEKCRILTIHNWLIKWDNFSQLDEQITLAHILKVLDKAQMIVNTKEVRNCFDKHYNKLFHGDRLSYLFWLYKEFNVIIKSRDKPSKKGGFSPLELNKLSVLTIDNEKVDKLPTGVKNV